MKSLRSSQRLNMADRHGIPHPPERLCPGGQPGSGGDVRGADAVAVGDRSQPLYRAAQQPAEGLGLRLTQLRELLGHVRDRAVMLAQLLTAASAAAASRPLRSHRPLRRRGRGRGGSWCADAEAA